MNILDISNEILLTIFEKLNTVDVLYSLVDVNQRFDQIIFDFIDFHHVNMINSLSNYSIDSKVISRICDQVLFRIAHKIHQLTMEQCSMKQILDSCIYPQLDSLTLINCEEEILYENLQNDQNLREILTKQIKSFEISFRIKCDSFCKTASKIFALILSLCKNLRCFKHTCLIRTKTCFTSFYCYRPLFNVECSSLIKLELNIATFDDCFYILDGRFKSLEILIINVNLILATSLHLYSSDKLVRLKYFSLICISSTTDYKDLVVPLLCRMTNLERLRLYLNISKYNSAYIDGIQLYNDFLISMSHLNKFTFSINMLITNQNFPDKLQSNQDIQQSFISKGYEQIDSYVRANFYKTDCRCHIYSLPYDFQQFLDLNDDFPGGMFDKVRYLTVYDNIPLRQQLLKAICYSFPFVEYLSISNNSPLVEKRQIGVKLLRFTYLTSLNLKGAHADYINTFLLKKNADLPRLLNLRIKLSSLLTLTNNFTTRAIHFNFQTLKTLNLSRYYDRPQNFDEYFPQLEFIIDKL